MRRSSVFCALVLQAACAAAPSTPRALEKSEQKAQTQSAATVGESPPAFSVESFTTSGKVTAPPGQVTLVYFWATWNGPCKQSFPKLQELYAKYHARGLEIAALSVDDETNGVADAAKSWGAKFPVGWDGGHVITNAWKPSHMPTLYILDRRGIVRFVHGGWHDGQEITVDAEVLGLLE